MKIFLGNGLTLFAWTWRNHRVVVCAAQPPRATRYLFPRTSTTSHKSTKSLSLKRSPSVGMRGGLWLRGLLILSQVGNTACISLPSVPRECRLRQRGTSSNRRWWDCPKIHVKTSQSRFDSRCQSQTVAWIQRGVVEGDSHWGQSGF